MVKIFEMQQQLNDVNNYQSRIVEFESFQDYLDEVENRTSPIKENVEIGYKFVNHNHRTITFRFEHKLNERWIEFTHFAQVISE